MRVDNEKKPVLGIDLGTTYSAIARWTEKGPKVYQNPRREYTWASAVYYDERQDKPLVGNLALKRALIDPENAVIGVKRMMDNGTQKIRLGNKEFTPIEISSMILRDVYEYAEKTTPGFNPAGVVVTVPYYFTALQCTNTSEAASLAGLNVLGIIQEPVAAGAIALLSDHGWSPNSIFPKVKTSEERPVAVESLPSFEEQEQPVAIPDEQTEENDDEEQTDIQEEEAEEKSAPVVYTKKHVEAFMQEYATLRMKALNEHNFFVVEDLLDPNAAVYQMSLTIFKPYAVMTLRKSC
ncbi:Hsp70 family protein [Ectobacillus funiculus]